MYLAYSRNYAKNIQRGFNCPRVRVTWPLHFQCLCLFFSCHHFIPLNYGNLVASIINYHFVILPGVFRANITILFLRTIVSYSTIALLPCYGGRTCPQPRHSLKPFASPSRVCSCSRRSTTFMELQLLVTFWKAVSHNMGLLLGNQPDNEDRMKLRASRQCLDTRGSRKTSVGYTH